MIDPTKPEKLIQISPPSNVHPMTFETVDGRDTIAEQIKKDIDEYCEQAFSDEPRSHLGASVVGHNCERYIWYMFRWMVTEKFNGRMLRLFSRGHREEERIIEYLRGIGMKVISTDDNGKQIRIIDVGDHFGGSIDGKGLLPERYGVQPTKLLLEFKTSANDGFNRLAGSGVIKEKPRHYSQMSVYGYKLGIKYALYICVNKNNDELDVEIIELDFVLAQKEIAKAEKIIFAAVPPMRLSQNPAYYECKFCSASQVCHWKGNVNKNCRSCINSKPSADGKWYCNQWQAEIPLDFIEKGCDAWQTFLH